MKDLFYKISTIIILILLAFVARGVMGNNPTDLSLKGLTDSACAVSSVASVAVGDDISSTVVSATSNRAYARIGVADAETEPIFLSFDEGAAATVGNGLIISATSSPYIEFGRGTLFPYTGAVTAITGSASTTLSVTVCNY